MDDSSAHHPARHLADGTVRSLLAEALILPTGLITVAFLTRRLGPQAFGLFTLAAAVVAWIEWSINAVFSRATIKLVGEVEDWRPVGSTVMRLQLATSGGATVLVWLLAGYLAALFAEPVLATYLRLFALDIPFFTLARVHRQILIGIGEFQRPALATAGRWIGRLVLIVVLVELGLSVQGAILGSIGASIVELAIGRVYVRPSFSDRASLPPRRVWDYAVPLSLFALSLRLFDRLDLFALKVMGGTAVQAGIYGAAQNLSLLPGIFALSLSPLLLSELGRTLRAGDGASARAMGRNAMRLVIGLLPFAGLIAGAAPEIVSLVFGVMFLPAAPLLSLLIFAALAFAMISVATAILTAAGKPGWSFAVAGPLPPLALVGHLLLIPRLGAIGAALVATVTAGLGALGAVAAVYRLWRVLPPVWTLYRSLLVCGCVYALAVFWPAQGLMVVLKLSLAGFMIGLFYFFLGEFTPREIDLMRTLGRGRLTLRQNLRNV